MEFLYAINVGELDFSSAVKNCLVFLPFFVQLTVKWHTGNKGRETDMTCNKSPWLGLVVITSDNNINMKLKRTRK